MWPRTENLGKISGGLCPAVGHNGLDKKVLCQIAVVTDDISYAINSCN